MPIGRSEPELAVEEEPEPLDEMAQSHKDSEVSQTLRSPRLPRLERLRFVTVEAGST